MFKASEYCKTLVMNFEGFREKKYRDLAGYWSIGFGHKYEYQDSTSDTITVDEGIKLLWEDLHKAESILDRYVKVNLNQGQVDALVSWVFNLGEGHFKGSTLLRKLNEGDYEGAADEFTRWVYVHGVVIEGLVARRLDERNMFLGVMKMPKKMEKNLKKEAKRKD